MILKKKITIFFFLISFIIESNCFFSWPWTPRMRHGIQGNVCNNCCRKNCCYPPIRQISEPRPATIFIHGSLYPLVNVLVHALDSPIGLIPAKVQGNKYLHGRVSYILNDSDPGQFPLDSFYLYGWSGKITFEGREKAAFDLYQRLKNFTGPLTIITHSHGGNVALNLAKVAQKMGDTNFRIDKLILLACPVQSVTEDCVHSPVFKRIYSLYSTGDNSQVKDPQGLYHVTRHYRRMTGKKGPVFSQRIFPNSPNLIQQRIILGRRNMCHMEFLYTPFLGKLPQVLSLVDNNQQSGLVNTCNKEYIINVQRNSGPPQLMVKCHS